jgi:uncharacterized coiled-coil DUF342 family protein
MSNAEFSRLFNLYVQINTLKLDIEQLKESGDEKNKSVQTKINRLEKEIEMLERLLETPTNPARMENLLYLEKCSEYGKSMKVMPSPEAK